MRKEQKLSYKNYVVSLSCGDYYGSGFYIARDLICTCYHVIEKCSCDDIIVKWRDKEISVLDCTFYEDLDIAFLRTNKAGNEGWIPLQILQNFHEGNHCKSFGYPDGYEESGSPLYVNYTGSDINNEILTFSGDNITLGFSGSPIVDATNESLIAMLSISRDISNVSGGRGISINLILHTLCHDKKFGEFALQMLQPNEFFGLEKSYWAFENTDIDDVVSFHIKEMLKYNNRYPKDSPLDIYIRLRYHNDVYNNPYVAVAQLMKDKYKNICITYIDWLNSNLDESDKCQIEEAVIFIQKEVLPLPNMAIDKVEGFCKQLKSARIAGSSCMKLHDLFSKSGRLKVPFHWESNDIQKLKDQLEVTLIKHLKNGTGFLILANPGVGKSTLSKALYLDIIRQRKANKTRFIPLFIDLHQELIKRERTFNVKWLKKRITQQYGEIENVLLGEAFDNVVIILDGLDEYLDGLDRLETETFFSSELFNCIYKYKVVVTCRDQFYTRSVAGFNNRIDSFPKIVITPWSMGPKIKYIYQYIQHLKNKKRITNPCNQSDIIRLIESSPFLKEVTDTPLYLNMTIEVLSVENLKPINSIIDLYEQYAYNWIRNEKQRLSEYDLPANVIQDDPSFILHIVAALSWQYHELAFADRFNNSHNFRFSYREIEKYLKEEKDELGLLFSKVSDYNKMAKFIAEHTFFVSDSSLNLFYIHKSFYEYFSAKFIFDMLVSDKADVFTIIKVHASLLSPEVSELLKEHIKKISNLRLKQHTFLKNCKNSLTFLKENYILLDLDSPSKRIARQQIIYHIGLIELQESSEYLKSILSSETDPWIRRGIIIGLSFSGDMTELNSYIEHMRVEVEQEKPWKENDVNIGFSLSFFGDQPYDNYAPDYDQQLPRCKNTVERLIYQLSTEIDRPSWRSNMYTLVYLASYRPISYEDYCETMLLHEETLIKILDKLEYNEGVEWPEIKQLREIIGVLKRKGGFINERNTDSGN